MYLSEGFQDQFSLQNITSLGDMVQGTQGEEGVEIYRKVAVHILIVFWTTKKTIWYKIFKNP